ncbi:MAG: hypothetical protein U9O86_08600 [Campylobacterota bacterium]|nr:hypothetical protein [Campylobacterota bacterium]
MIKVFLLLYLLLPLQLFAIHYNSTIIEIEAKLFPKMIMLSEDIDKNATVLKIDIIAHKQDLAYAREFKESIQAKYPEKLINKVVKVSISKLGSLNEEADAFIVLDHTEKELQKIANFANTRKILSFAYDPSYMDSGILAAIYIGISTKPYLNKEIIQKYNFTFNPYLLELSKFK